MSSVSGEVGHVALLLQIPDLDLGVASPGTEDQTIRMELETSINLTLNIFTILLAWLEPQNAKVNCRLKMLKYIHLPSKRITFLAQDSFNHRA